MKKKSAFIKSQFTNFQFRNTLVSPPEKSAGLSYEVSFISARSSYASES